MDLLWDSFLNYLVASSTSRIVREQLISRVFFNLLLKSRVTVCSGSPRTASVYACCPSIIISVQLLPWSQPYAVRSFILSRMHSFLPSSPLCTPKACKSTKEGNLVFLKARFLAVVLIFLLPPAEYQPFLKPCRLFQVPVVCR